MVFLTKIKGRVIEDKFSSKGTRYIKVYNGSNLVNVFVNDDSPYSVGDEVDISCIVSTKDAFIKKYVD